MKRLFTMLALLTAVGRTALAEVDLAAWMEKRAILSEEAERLRLAYAKHSGETAEVVEGIEIPLETYDDGTVKIQVKARRARFVLKENLLVTEGLVIRKLDESGGELSRIEAEDCIIDRDTKSGWAKGKVKVTNDKTVFTGEDAYFSSIEGYVISSSASKIVSTDMKFGGAL